MRACGQAVIVAPVSREVLEGGKGPQFWCGTEVHSHILMSPGLSRLSEREIQESEAVSSQSQSFYKKQNCPNELEKMLNCNKHVQDARVLSATGFVNSVINIVWI